MGVYRWHEGIQEYKWLCHSALELHNKCSVKTLESPTIFDRQLVLTWPICQTRSSSFWLKESLFLQNCQYAGSKLSLLETHFFKISSFFFTYSLASARGISRWRSRPKSRVITLISGLLCTWLATSLPSIRCKLTTYIVVWTQTPAPISLMVFTSFPCSFCKPAILSFSKALLSALILSQG